MTAPRGLAIDCNDGRVLGPQRLHPAQKAGLERLTINRGDHVAQHVVAWDAAPIRAEPAQDVQVLSAPQGNLNKVVRSRNGRAQQQQQDFRQRIQHLAGLARVVERGEMGQKR
jgi:hypothetical protein